MHCTLSAVQYRFTLQCTSVHCSVSEYTTLSNSGPEREYSTLQYVYIAVPQSKMPLSLASFYTHHCHLLYSTLYHRFHWTDSVLSCGFTQTALLAQYFFGWFWQILIWDKQACLGLHPNFTFSCSFSKVGEYLLLISGTESDGEDVPNVPNYVLLWARSNKSSVCVTKRLVLTDWRCDQC